jgi:hypothetical protein
MNDEIKKILYHGTRQERRALFGFDKQTSDDKVLLKFNLWSKFFFDKYFTSKDAPFHQEIDLYNLKAYKEEFTFVDIAFRGASKTSRTKLFLAFAIANDFDHYRKYIKILSYEMANSKQIVTDIYNMFVSENIKILYPEIFARTNAKREETMGAFTTSAGVKLYADTVGTTQRGALQEYSRPDLILFEDIETRKTLRSAVITKAIWDNMEEARTSLAIGGSCVYNCFGKDTGFVTNQGIKLFRDLHNGQEIVVLSHLGNWKKAVVKHYGKNKLIKYIFRRGRAIEKTVWATENHSWILVNGERTMALKTGDYVLSAPNIFDEFVYNDADFEERLYWAYGFIFGDGTLFKDSLGEYSYSAVRVCGSKVEKFLYRFNELGFKNTAPLSLRGDVFVYTGKYLKTLPDPIIDDPHLIRAFVRGFLDADGIKGVKRNRSPFVQLVQTNKFGADEFIKNIFPIAGVFITYEKMVESQEKTVITINGKNCVRDKTTKRYGLGSNFISSNVNGHFIAEKTSEFIYDDTWCLEVEDDHSFVLDCGLSTGNCNYISEAGNVHKLVTKQADKKKLLIVPIIDDKNKIAWDRYTMADIELMRQTDDDYEGERLCKPSAGADIMFDRNKIEEQIKNAIEPIRKNNDFKIFKEFDTAGRYAMGCDIAGGVGLDSSTSVIIDFNSYPAEVVATYNNNTIKPDLLAYEFENQAKEFGNCLIAPESNNHGNSTIAILKQLQVNLYKRQPKESKIMVNPPVEYGWETNAVTKPKMIFGLVEAINKGHLILNDISLTLELKSYTRNDLMDKPIDPRLTTRHFDLLIACCVAWQMKDYRWYSNNNPTVYRPLITRRV